MSAQAAHECEWRVICCLLIRTQAGRLGWGRLGLVWGRILCIRTSPCLAAALRNSRPVLAVVTSSTVTVTVTAGGAHSSSSSSLWLLSTKLGWLLLLSLPVQNVDFLLICSAFVVAAFFLASFVVTLTGVCLIGGWQRAHLLLPLLLQFATLDLSSD